MSNAYATTKIQVSGRGHTWRDEQGTVYSLLDLGSTEIIFDSADDARLVASRCLEIADAIDTKTVEGTPS